MARKRDPRRDEAYEIWKKNKGEITNRAIAEQLDVPEKTISGWKSKDKWNDKLNGVLQTKIRSTPNKVKSKSTRDPNKKGKAEPIVESDELTDKQRLFCLYYTKYWNATKAYQKAYECDYFSAMSAGSRMLRNVKVSEEINEYKKMIAEGLMIDGTAVLQKYIDIAFADITDFVDFGQKDIADVNPITGDPLLDDNGEQVTYPISFVNFKDSSEVDGTIITEVKKGKDGVSVKLADKMKALEFLAKYTDLLSENDKKRLQEEKLKAETERIKAESNKIGKGPGKEPLLIEIDYGDDDNE